MSLRSTLLFIHAVHDLISTVLGIQLKSDSDERHHRYCHDKKGTQIWFTPNKSAVWIASDLYDPVVTPENRIIYSPEDEEEKNLQEYFTKTKFPYADIFLETNRVFIPFYDKRMATEQSTNGTKWKRILRQVMTWMMEHKYLETDPRLFKYLAVDPKDRFYQRINYRQFPLPPLQNFHPIVEESCKKGLLYCLKTVHEQAFGHMQQFNKYLNMDRSRLLKHHDKLILKKGRYKKLSADALRNAKDEFCHEQSK